ncbi:hypothetical protein J1N35_005606, partial [Gossypium stocksii]
SFVQLPQHIGSHPKTRKVYCRSSRWNLCIRWSGSKQSSQSKARPHCLLSSPAYMATRNRSITKRVIFNPLDILSDATVASWIYMVVILLFIYLFCTIMDVHFQRLHFWKSQRM